MTSLISMYAVLSLDEFKNFVDKAKETISEIMKALEANDLDTLRVIYLDARKGNAYVADDLLEMVGAFIKNNSL